MKKGTAVLCSLILLAACMIAGCDQPGTKKNEEEIILEKIRDIRYAEIFSMESDDNILYRTDARERLENDEDKKNKEIIFVLMKPDVKDNEHIVIFPTETTQIYIDNYNRFIERENLDLSPFHLAYPITMENILENRENILALMDATSESVKNQIFRSE